jgi:putative addiction module component (TIGR02574 family)
MTENEIAEILKLPAEEKLRLLELVWDSLAANPSAIPVSDAQQAIIDERLAEHARNPKDVLTVDDVLGDGKKAR